MEQAKTIKFLATYSRVSTSNQEDQQTIEIQLSTLRDFAKEKGYSIVKEYTDDGWSGDMLARPALDQLRQDAKERVWEAVLIYDPDRLARRYSYQELVMDELREAGIEVMFVTIPTPKNSEDKILHGVRGLFAEYERAKIAERFRLGKLRKAKEGYVLTTEAPYGYRYIRNNKETKTHGYYEINEEEARVVRMIFQWVADEGLTLRSVVRRLQEMGIKPRKSKRGVWNTSTLTTLLRHKGYIGEAYWGRSYAVVPEKPLKVAKYKKMKKTSRRIRPENEWYKIPIPALIDRELFNRARAQLEANFKLCQRNKKNEYLLANVIYCPCGRRRAGEGPQRGKHLYYRCTDRVYSFPLPRNCNEGGINARIADNLVWERIVQLMSSRKQMEAEIKQWLNDKKGKAQTSVGDLPSIENEIAKLKNEEDRYSKAYGAGVFTMEQLQEYSASVRERITALETQKAKIQQASQEVDAMGMPNEREIALFAKEAKGVLLGSLNFEEKREIVVNTVEKIEGTQEWLRGRGHIAIPISANNHVVFNTIGRNCGVAERGEIHVVPDPYEKKGGYFELSVCHHRP